MNRRIFVKTLGAAGASLLVTNEIGKSISLAAQRSRPNILFIITDQQATDAMSWKIGGKYINTPAMDELASHSTIFSLAFAANPLCCPCRSSLFTGFYPHQTKIETNQDEQNYISDRFQNMGAIFRDAGYDTGYTGKWHMAFDVKDTAVHGFNFMQSIKSNGIDPEIPASAREFFKIKRDKPFLLVTSFVDPHNICEWARGGKLPDGEVGNPPPLEDCPPDLPNELPMTGEPDIIADMKKAYQRNRLFPVGGFTDDKWRQYRWAYFRMIEKVDSLIGEVLFSLKETGNYENTVIVFTSDHGDMQGAHGWNQKTVLFEESVRIPLMISEPGKRKKVIDHSLVNTGIDIMPTLCDYAGISLPDNYPGLGLRRNKISSRKYVVTENKMNQGEPVDGVKLVPSGRMVRSKRYKYCIYDIGARNESFVDLEKDPGETINLIDNAGYKKIADEHRKYLAGWCKENNDDYLNTLSTK